MTITFLLVLALGGVAIAVSLLVNRRSPDSPTVPRFVLPFQLDRSDFERPTQNGCWFFSLRKPVTLA